MNNGLWKRMVAAAAATALFAASAASGLVMPSDAGVDSSIARGQNSSVSNKDGENEQFAVPPSVLAWSDGLDCSSCHEKQSLVDSPLAQIHGARLGLVCSDCHADEAIVEVHEKADKPKKVKRLRKTEVPEGACVVCHGEGEPFLDLVPESSYLADANGTVVNPHDVPDIEKHATITCRSCHGYHDEGKDDAAQFVCKTCHHANVYECGTCHS